MAQKAKKLLGVDFGMARTGLAHSDDLGIFAIGMGNVKSYNREKAAAEVAAKALEIGAETIVIGMMPDHIKWERIFTTTYLTTFRIGLLGDSSTQRTLYQFFRIKKHVLDAISRKKLYPFAWGSRDPECKHLTSCAISFSLIFLEISKTNDQLKRIHY